MDAELSRAFNVCFKTLRVCGWWQSGNQSWLYLIYGCFAIVTVVETYIVSQILYISQVGSLNDFIDTLGLFLTFLATQSKTINFLYKIRRIKQLVKDLDELLRFTEHTLSVKRGHIKRRVNAVYRLYLAYWALGVVSCTAFFISILIYRQLPYKLWFPFDIETSSVGFWSAATYTVVQSYIATAVAIALDIMPVIFIGFAVGLIEEFSERLGKVKTTQELVKCVEIHNKIKNYIAGIQDNFATVILIQGFMSSIILCVCAFSLSTVSRFLVQNWNLKKN